MTLVLNGLTKRLGSFLLHPLDLEVQKGEYFVLVGPSGVGKTVLLELIAGLLTPDNGRISWDGREVGNEPPESRGFGIVYQDYALFPHLKVKQNVGYGIRQSKDDARINEISKLTGIVELLDRWPGTLSGGEQQRVALARALAPKPGLLLLDEPLCAVDLRQRRQLRRELKQIQQQTGATFLHVTHDVDEALALGDRIAVMMDSRISSIATPEELFQHPHQPEVAAFLGIRNVIKIASYVNGICELRGVSIHIGNQLKPFSHIWIRPEEIILSLATFMSSARNQLACRVQSWEFHDVLVSVKVACGDLELTALVTYHSFEELALAEGKQLYATFKSSAMNCL